MSDTTPEDARTALLHLIARLPDEAVLRLWRVVWFWVQGPGEPPTPA